MPSDRLARGLSSSNPLLGLTSLQFSGFVVLSPRLGDFTCFPAPNGLELAVDADHGGVVFEVPADNPQRGGDCGGKAVVSRFL